MGRAANQLSQYSCMASIYNFSRLFSLDSGEPTPPSLPPQHTHKHITQEVQYLRRSAVMSLQATEALPRHQTE